MDIGLYNDAFYKGKRRSNKAFYIIAAEPKPLTGNEYQGMIRTLTLTMARNAKGIKNDIEKALPDKEVFGSFTNNFGKIVNLDDTTYRQLLEMTSEFAQIKSDINAQAKKMAEEC